MPEDMKMLIHTVGGLSFVGLSLWLLVGAVKKERQRQLDERRKQIKRRKKKRRRGKK